MSGNLRQTWKLINTIISKKKDNTICTIFRCNDAQVADKNEIVEKFNEYFVNIGSSLAAQIPISSKHFSHYLRPQALMHSFSLYLCDPHEIFQIISKLPNKNSSGFDSIPMHIMKIAASYISEPISEIINKSFSSGIFPDVLKIAKICPIHKNGDKDLFANYRPISILPSFSKIFEKAVYNRLLQFLDRNLTLVNNQYGFRKKTLPIWLLWTCMKESVKLLIVMNFQLVFLLICPKHLTLLIILYY